MYAGFVWWRGKPELAEVEGHLVIRLRGGVSFYRLMWDAPVEQMPHSHLLRVKTVEDALDFVKRFGLLGLWATKTYAMWQPSEGPDRGTARLLYGQWCSKWFLKDGYAPGGADFYSQWQEPLDLFMQAALEFQLAAEEALGGGSDAGPLHEFLEECHPEAVRAGGEWQPAWSAPSLLHACYLGLWTDMTDGRRLRRCEYRHCGRLFYATRQDRRFCSPRCQANEKRLRHYHSSAIPETRTAAEVAGSGVTAI
ncbi:MAG: CGNR zinc finger domain-containing protein [Thermacetogeniaceae bacterium]